MRITVRYGFEKNNNTKSGIDNIHSNFSEIKAIDVIDNPIDNPNFSEINVIQEDKK